MRRVRDKADSNRDGAGHEEEHREEEHREAHWLPSRPRGLRVQHRTGCSYSALALLSLALKLAGKEVGLLLW